GVAALARGAGREVGRAGLAAAVAGGAGGDDVGAGEREARLHLVAREVELRGRPGRRLVAAGALRPAVGVGEGAVVVVGVATPARGVGRGREGAVGAEERHPDAVLGPVGVAVAGGAGEGAVGADE